MAYVAGGALAAAVSRAGGLGIVGRGYAGTVSGEAELDAERGPAGEKMSECALRDNRVLGDGAHGSRSTTVAARLCSRIAQLTNGLPFAAMT